MAFHLYEDTWETTLTVGQGDYVLAGAVAGWRAFSAQYADGDTTWFSAFDGANFEHGIGTFHAPHTLTRTTILRSTNGGNAVVWATGTRQITVAPLGIGLEQMLNVQGTAVSDTPPLSPKVGTLWFDTIDGHLYCRYDDGTSAQWVSTAGAAGPAGSPNDVGRNLIHNPLFNIAQRGAGPFTVATVTGYGLDRWATNVQGADAASFQRFALTDSDRAQIGDEAAAYTFANNFTGSSSGYTEITQRIEDVRRLAGKTITLSFFSDANATLKLGINAGQSMGTGGSPSGAVNALTTGLSVTLGANWQRHSVSFALPSLAGKTLGTNNDHYTMIRVAYSSGTSTDAFFGNIGVQSGIVNLWGIQLEVGSVATPLEKPDPQQDLAKCQRFYQVGNFSLWAYGQIGTQFGYSKALNGAMRASPTVTLGTPGTANIGALTATASSYDVTIAGVPTATAFVAISGGFTASADL